jgi:hypothetical protein
MGFFTKYLGNNLQIETGKNIQSIQAGDRVIIETDRNMSRPDVDRIKAVIDGVLSGNESVAILPEGVRVVAVVRKA